MFNNLRAHQGGYPNPTVAAKFAQSANDFTTLLTTTSMPSGGSITRTGQAMVYDSTGKLTYAPNNLLTYSQDFQTTSEAGSTRPWLIGNGSSTITVNSASAPDATNTASLMSYSAAAYPARYQAFTAVSGVTYIFSVWMKLSSGSGASARIEFYSPGGFISNASTNTTIDATWKRISVVATATGSGSCHVFIDPCYVASATGSALIWGAQLEAVTYQTTPSTYVATTTAAYYGPRFDYDPSTLAAKGLLIEGTRTNVVAYSSAFSGWTTYDSPVATTTNIAPDGTTTAYSWAYNTGFTGYYRSDNIVANTTYTISCYVKYISGSAPVIFFGNTSSVWGTGIQAKAQFNPQTQTFTSSDASIINKGYQALANGWYRVWITATTTSSGGVAGQSVAYINASGSLAIWGFQCEAGAFPTSYIPTVASSVARAAETFSITGYSSNLINATYIDEATGVTSVQPYNAGTAPSPSFSWLTSLRAYTNAYAGSIASPSWLSFSRSGNAMMTDSTGKLTYAPANMMTYSEQLDNAAWTKSNITISADAIIAPNGALTADKLVENTATSTHYLGSNIAITIGQPYVLSFYAKKAERSSISIGGAGLGGAGYSCLFDVNAGSLSGAPTGASIVSVGNGWYRCSIYWTPTNTSVFTFSMYNGSVTYTGDGTSGLYIWGAQLEPVTYETQPSAYIPTTTAAVYGPRYDYDASTVPATPRGLLIEESRANLVTFSEQFDNAAWTKGNATVTANAAIAPDGTNSADKLVDNSTSGAHSITSIPVTFSATAYTYTFYAKAAERPFARSIISDGTSFFTAYFNLTTGVVGTLSGTGTTASMVSVGNGWYRCATTATTASGAGNVNIRTATANGTDNYAGDGTSGIFIWGAQLEAGSFATSYIPTTSASVTRAADVAQLTGSALTTLQGSALSVFGEATLYSTSGSPLLIGGPASQLALIFANGASTANSFDAASSPTAVGTTTAGSGTWVSGLRAGLAANSSGRSLVVNGGVVITSNAAIATARTNAQLGAYVGGTQPMNGWYRSFAAYNQRLPDAILKQKSAIGAPY